MRNNPDTDAPTDDSQIYRGLRPHGLLARKRAVAPGAGIGVLDWDAAGYGDRALDVAYFRMNMHLRGIKEAADIFLDCYESESGAVSNLGFWELACAARSLPNPAGWIPASREMGDLGSTDDRADTDYYEFVRGAMQRAYSGR